MRVLLLALGTRGDVEPYTVLARLLLDAGHTVEIATHPVYQDIVKGAGIPFGRIAGNPELMVADAGASLQLMTLSERLRNAPSSFVPWLGRLAERLRPAFDRIVADAWKRSEKADAIVCHPLARHIGYSIAEKKKIPFLIASPFPSLPTNERCHPSLFLPALLGPLSPWASHRWANQSYWLALRSTINAWRRDTLGLPEWPSSDPTVWGDAAIPTLEGYSERILARPADAKPCHHVVGPWLRPPQAAWTPPDALRDLLAADGPVASVGSYYGDVVIRHVELAVAVALELGVRVVVSRQHLSEGSPHHGSPSVCVVDNVPHAWLFPRMTFVMHHGGAGVTATAARAGTPAVVIPYTPEQAFWARRIFAIGVAAPPLFPESVTRDALAARFRRALNDERMRQTARALGAQLSADDVSATVSGLFSRYLHTSPFVPQ